MTVLLFTTMAWPFAARLAGAFADLGTRVEALCLPHAPLARSRHVARRHAYHPLAPFTSLRRAAGRAAPLLVIPCDDPAADLLARFEGKALPGRVDFLSRAEAAGAPVAGTMALEKDADLDGALARFGLPLVLKHEPGWGGEGVAIAADRAGAEAALSRFRRPVRLLNLARWVKRRESHFLTAALHPGTEAFSAQRFIPGIPATSVLACWKGALLAAHHFDVRVTGAGPQAPASVVTRRDCPAMEDSARRIAAAFGLSGLYGLDYMRGSDGAVHLLEMNARATPTAHLSLVHDLPAALLAAAGVPVRRRPPATALDDIALFPGEWLRDPASPWLSRAFHDVPWDDPAVLEGSLANAPARS
jgi:hypothetical protein